LNTQHSYAKLQTSFYKNKKEAYLKNSNAPTADNKILAAIW
jgi:hypothetical protein